MPHSATADNNSFDTGIVKPGASASHTFTQAGTFTYHCTVHPFMHGTVVVLATVATTPTTTTAAPTTTTPAASSGGLPMTGTDLIDEQPADAERSSGSSCGSPTGRLRSCSPTG